MLMSLMFIGTQWILMVSNWLPLNSQGVGKKPGISTETFKTVVEIDLLPDLCL